MVLVPCLLLWATLYALGLLNEGCTYAERARLAVVMPLGVIAMARLERFPDDSLTPIWGGFAVYLLSSLAALRAVVRKKKIILFNKI